MDFIGNNILIYLFNSLDNFSGQQQQLTRESGNTKEKEEKKKTGCLPFSLTLFFSLLVGPQLFQLYFYF